MAKGTIDSHALFERIRAYCGQIRGTIDAAVAAAGRDVSELAGVVIVPGRTDIDEIVGKLRDAGCGDALRDEPTGALVFVAEREAVARALKPNFAKTVREAEPIASIMVCFVPGATVAINVEPLPEGEA